MVLPRKKLCLFELWRGNNEKKDVGFENCDFGVGVKRLPRLSLPPWASQILANQSYLGRILEGLAW